MVHVRKNIGSVQAFVSTTAQINLSSQIPRVQRVCSSEAPVLLKTPDHHVFQCQFLFQICQ